MINPITEEEFSRIKELRKTKSTAEVAEMINRSGVSVQRVNQAFDWNDYIARKKAWAEEARNRGKSPVSSPDPRIAGLKTLQANILSKFMTPEEYEALIKRYNENRRGLGVELRERTLKIPVLGSEKLALLKYLNSANSIVVREILKNPDPNLINQVGKIAVKFLYQNKELLNLDELLGGGENS